MNEFVKLWSMLLNGVIVNHRLLPVPGQCLALSLILRLVAGVLMAASTVCPSKSSLFYRSKLVLALSLNRTTRTWEKSKMSAYCYIRWCLWVSTGGGWMWEYIHSGLWSSTWASVASRRLLISDFRFSPIRSALPGTEGESEREWSELNTISESEKV